MKTKHCHKCDRTLSESHFYKNKRRKDGLGTACKECHKKENLEYRQRHPDRVYSKEFSAKIAIANEVFGHYGNGKVECARCGFDDLRALSIDHINGGGCAHRKKLKRTGTSFYRWLRDSDYPEGFQVLCMNCQFIKRHENKEHRHKIIQAGSG